MSCRSFGVPAGAVAAALCSMVLLAGTASAAPTAKITVGPVPVPDVSVQACIGDVCGSTPPASSVTLTLSAVAAGSGGIVAAPPSVLPGTCPKGAAGAAATVTAGAAAATLTGKFTVKVNGAKVEMPVNQTLAKDSPPVTFSICVR